MNTTQLDMAFGALSHQVRRGILANLMDGPATVSELAAPYDMSLPAVSLHLKTLEKAGLIERQVTGRVHKCSVRREGLAPVLELMEEYKAFWTSQFSSLETFIRTRPAEGTDDDNQ